MGYKGGDNSFKITTNTFSNRTINPNVNNAEMLKLARKRAPAPAPIKPYFFSKPINLFKRSSNYLTRKVKGLYKGSKNNSKNTSKNTSKNSPNNAPNKSLSKKINIRNAVSYQSLENWARENPINYEIYNPMSKGIKWANSENNGNLAHYKPIPHRNDEQ